ncbi:MAG: metallophosphoesterase, partial [Anaeroplasmataceae bacterium]|nr:metallophosphoesterase [Anaeroplasmataceae bacterium]
MKVAIFSDIHGNLEALEAILEDIKKNQFDEVICLGDVIGIGPSPKECLQKIQEGNIRLLLGNHERCYLMKDDTLSIEEQKHYQWINSVLGEEYKSYLNSCALSYKIQDVLFEHFIIEDETKVNPFVGLSDEKVISSKIKEVDAKLIFVGHQHRPFLADKMICIGSSGCTKNNKTFYY